MALRFPSGNASIMTQLNSHYLLPQLRRNPSEARHLMEEKGKNIFHGRLVTDDFCDVLMDRIHEYEIAHLNSGYKSANSMHTNAILTKELKLENFILTFVHAEISNIIGSVFDKEFNREIHDVHSYVVRYENEIQADRELGFHVDDSFLTINLCLNEGFEGSNLIFEGLRCPAHIDTPSRDSEHVQIRHQKGFMVFHDGKNRHFVNPIRQGKRYGLIIWCQNRDEKATWFNAHSSRQCMDFCGWQ